MFTATTYIVVSIGLAVVMYFGAKEHHQAGEGVEVYRYPSLYVRIMFIGIPAWLLMGGVVYSTYPPGEPRGIVLFFLIASFAGLSIGYIFIYLIVKKFYIEIDEQCIRVGGIRPERTIAFEDIRKLELTQGIKGTQALSLFDAQGRRILKAANTLQDFDDLEALIEQHLVGRGVLMRYRDDWGKWTERRS